MDLFYRVYGLTVASTQYLPYLTPIDTETTKTVDVRITFLPDRSEHPPLDGSFSFWKLPEGGLGFRTLLTAGHAEYTISADGSSICVTHSEDAPFLEVMRYLTGVSLGAALRYRSVLCLHASAVQVNESVLIFTGPSHAGKSTLCAAFNKRGYPLISEDVVAIDVHDNRAYARPGYAGIRLYPDTLNHFYSSAAAEALPVEHKFLHQLEAIPTASCPIQRLYLLAPRNPSLQQPRVTPVDKTSALFALTSQLYLHRFAGQQWLGRDFPRLGEFVQRVPVYWLERTDSLSDLGTAIDFILE